jgi:glycosyltransferase involved in cell wall biosynthesis
MAGSQGKAKVLFVCSALSTFVRNDLRILEKHFNIRRLIVTMFLVPRKGSHWLANYFRLLKGILCADVVYAWWAELNAFFIVLFCMILRKKSIVIVGGYEVAYVPEINYGTLLSPIGRLEVKFILRHASKILAVSKSSEKEILHFAKPKTLKLVYNGVDTKKFGPSSTKENLVLTVVNTVSAATIGIKRLDTFLRASVYLPDVKFILVGEISAGSMNSLKKMGGSNVKFTGYLNYGALLPYYQKAKVYCQLSAHESFGMALAEAMSCCCVPVVTRKYSLPEIVDDTGFYVPYNDPEATAGAIRQALTSNKGLKARARIEKYFSSKTREKKLIREISDSIEQK